MSVVCPLSHYTRSHAVKKASQQSKEETDNTATEKTEQVTSDMKQGLRLLNLVIFKEIQTINTILRLFNMLWQITVLP